MPRRRPRIARPAPSRRHPWSRLAVGVAVFLAHLLAALAIGGGPAAAADPNQRPVPGFVGGAVCADCHAREAKAWQGSHHDLAMQPATPATVLGDFADASHTHFDITSRFFRRGDRFFVNTESETGVLKDYEIAYTFGVYPLQQYLIAFPGGRYQALSLAWDSRPKAQGGQRWFHLYPDERIPPGDILHWTALNQNWNYMCADCHSTALTRNYDLAADRYTTTWSEIDVSCETCHGPGAEHVASAASAAAAAPGKPPPPVTPPVPRFNDRDGVGWAIEPPAVTARRTVPPPAVRAEVEACAPCHARRGALGDWIGHGRPLQDAYRPSLLTEGLYHADGQMQDEVYNYGSFLQSKMYRAGVTCSDCHDPHSLQQRAAGNGVCLQCHAKEAFDSARHHFHQPDGAGGSCVACHAPTVTYMVVDPRHDHSFRIPRPDLTEAIGVPNACTGCHAEQPASWAAAKVAAWYGTPRPPLPAAAIAVAAARSGSPGWRDKLIGLAADPAQAGIVRATALEMLGRRPEAAAVPALTTGRDATDPLLRLAAAGAADGLAAEQRLATAVPLTTDPLRAVRLEAARALAPLPLDAVPADKRAAVAAALAEYETAATAMTDRPEGLIRRAEFRLHRGEPLKAEADLRLAMQRHPDYVPAYINLADLYRLTGREADGERVLTAGLARLPGDAVLGHALGLLRIRQQRYAEAADLLARSAAAAPANPHYAFVASLGLAHAGRHAEADKVIVAALDRHPNDLQLLALAAGRAVDGGRTADAGRYLERLTRLAPDDPEVARLRARLGQPPQPATR